MPAKPGPLRPHEERQNYARKPLPSTPGEPYLGDSFLIVTEGEVAERMYFENLRALLQLNPVTVRVVHPACTDAEGLVRAAMEEQDKQRQRAKHKTIGIKEVEEFDHVWVLFDTDVCSRQGQLEPAMALAKKEGIYVGHSTPCVETWLILHFRDRPGPLMTSVAAETELSRAWGQDYKKTEDLFPKLWKDLRSNIVPAVNRGNQTREYHEKAHTPFPEDPSTQLDLLVRSLNDSARPEFRIPI